MGKGIIGRDFLNNGLNASYKSLLSKFVYYFESDFPLKTHYKKGLKNSRCIVKGIKVSCQSMRFVNNLNINLTPTGKF
jgi:hypothetical protein